jgi:hypothetical protein
MNNIKKFNAGNLSNGCPVIFTISTRFITIGCVLNKTFRIVYDQDEEKFINSCKYCGRQCKVKKIINKYIERGKPFNFDDLITKKKQKRKKRRKIRTKKV